MRKLKLLNCWNYDECDAEQKSLYNKSNKFRETLIDVSSVSKVKSKHFENAEKDSQYKSNYDQWFSLSYHNLVNTRWYKHEAIQNIKVTMVIQQHLKEKVAIHRNLKKSKFAIRDVVRAIIYFMFTFPTLWLWNRWKSCY